MATGESFENEKLADSLAKRQGATGERLEARGLRGAVRTWVALVVQA